MDDISVRVGCVLIDTDRMVELKNEALIAEDVAFKVVRASQLAWLKGFFLDSSPLPAFASITSSPWETRTDSPCTSSVQTLSNGWSTSIAKDREICWRFTAPPLRLS